MEIQVTEKEVSSFCTAAAWTVVAVLFYLILVTLVNSEDRRELQKYAVEQSKQIETKGRRR